MNLAARRGDQITAGRMGLLAGGSCTMGRAILALSGSAISLLPRPLAMLGTAFAEFWRDLTRDVIRPYRPELHYMRGPGPAWRAKQGLPPLG